MSIPFEQQISSTDNYILKINFSGFKDGIVSRDNLRLSIYAYHKITGTSVFSETLNFEKVSVLYKHLNGISLLKEDSAEFSNKFIELTENNFEIASLFQTEGNKLLKVIFDKVGDEVKQQILLDVLTTSDIKHLTAATRQTQFTLALDHLNEMLSLETTSDICISIKEQIHLSSYYAGQPEKIFQNWISKNIWILGIEYIKKHSARKIGVASESDLIMETTDGFIDLIELKRPKFEIFNYDESHKSYYPSKELAKVIGQSLHYLKVLDIYGSALEKEYKFKLLRPRIKIIIGRTNEFNDQQYESLRLLNSALNHISIISFDYLLLSGQTLLENYS